MSDTVLTDKGPVKGLSEKNLQKFCGIPYAKPPVGPLRFCAPEPCDPWQEAKDATQFGPSAPQAQGIPGMMPAGPFDEDCLYLNVYTPAADGGKRAVMFWIHGGAFVGGSGTTPMYDGGPLLSRHDVVLVTINYRLGALGYLDLSGIGGEAYGAVANCGQLDQIAALKWVKNNIAAFGGNPDDVTIFGESAGSMAVATLLAMPDAKGLFTKAICQSGGANNALSRKQADDLARAFLAEAGLSPESMEGLWDIPAEKMVKLQVAVTGGARSSGTGLRYVPIYETPALPQQPLDAIADGAAEEIPLIVGNNRDEEKLFTRMLVPNPPPITDDELVKKVMAQLPETIRDRDAPDVKAVANKMVAAYRASRQTSELPHDNNDIMDAIGGDAKFRIPGLMLLEAQAAHQPLVYSYLFCHESPARRGALGSCHALDLPFVFGTYELPGQDKFAGSGPAVEKLSQQMMDAWVAFAKTGHPGHDGIGQWLPYNQQERQTMIFGPETRLMAAPFEAERAAWDALLRG